MRLIFAGTPDVAVPSLRALCASKHEVVAVLTRPDTARGRGRKTGSSPVTLAARELGLQLLSPQSLSNESLRSQLTELQPDCCPIVAYGGLIPADLLKLPMRGWVNLHFSVLPAWRGAAPVQHAILHGDDVTGATTFALDEGLDTGPTYGVVTEPIEPNDTAGDVLHRLAEAGAPLLLRTIDGLEDGSIAAIPQPNDGVSYAPKMLVDDARIDWSSSALNVNRLVRACAPAPGAWTLRGEARLKVWATSIRNELALPPGRVRIGKNEVLVGCGIGSITLDTVQPEGKRSMAGADWVRGFRLEDSELLL